MKIEIIFKRQNNKKIVKKLKQVRNDKIYIRNSFNIIRETNKIKFRQSEIETIKEKLEIEVLNNLIEEFKENKFWW